MGVIYKKGRYLSLAARSFLQELQAYFVPGTRGSTGGGGLCQLSPLRENADCGWDAGRFLSALAALIV